LVLIYYLKINSQLTNIFQYGIVMDAGSSHTKLFVYKWNGEKEENTAVAEQIHTCSVLG